MPSKSSLSIKFNRLEIFDVFRVKEHISDSRLFFMNSQGISSQHNPLQNNFKRVSRQSDSRSYNIHLNWRGNIPLGEAYSLARWIDYWAICAGNNCHVFSQKPHVFCLVVFAGVVKLHRENRLDYNPPESTAEFHERFGRHDLRVFESPFYFEMYSRYFTFMRK